MAQWLLSAGLAIEGFWVRILLGALCFGNFPFTPLCQCLLEVTFKAVGPFYLTSVYARESKISHPGYYNLSMTPYSTWSITSMTLIKNSVKV